MENLRNANSRFALDLLRRFSETNPTGNIFFSPVSVSAALAMVLLGAKGNTGAQVLKVSEKKKKKRILFCFIFYLHYKLLWFRGGKMKGGYYFYVLRTRFLLCSLSLP